MSAKRRFWGQNTAALVPPVPYDADAITLFAEADIQPPVANKIAISNFFKRAKADGYFTALQNGFLYCGVAHSEQFQLLDWLHPTDVALTLLKVNSPVFGGNTGFWNDGRPSGYTNAKDLSAMGGISVNDTTCFLYISEGQPSDVASVGAGSTSPSGLRIWPRTVANTAGGRCNDSTTNTISSVTDIRGFTALVRSGANAKRFYKDATFTNFSSAGTAVKTAPFKIGFDVATSGAAPAQTISMTGVCSALTEAHILALRLNIITTIEALLGSESPAVVASRAGNVGETSFDLVFGLDRASTDSKLVVATAPSEGAIISTSTAISSTPYNTETLHYGKRSASGLTAGTEYYYNVNSGGHIHPGGWGRVKTLPVGGVPIAHDFIISSCTDTDSGLVIASMEKIADLEPDMIFLLGDTPYSNIEIDDISLHHAAQADVDSYPSFRAMLLAAGCEAIFDDHDAYSGDNSYIEKDANSADVRDNAIQAFRDQVPHWTFADTNDPPRSLARSKVIGDARYVMLDTRSQRTLGGDLSEGGVNCAVIGTATAPAGGFDEEQWLYDQLDAAVLAGNAPFFLFIPTEFPFDTNDGTFVGFAPNQVARICTYIRDNAPERFVTFVGGSWHSSFVDDGTSLDYSTGGGMVAQMICGSPLFKGSSGFPGGVSWLGGLSHIINSRSFVHVRVGADGFWDCDIWGRTVGSSKVVEIKMSFDQRDLP